MCIKKASFKSQTKFSHNYCDLIVINCVELMIPDKNMFYLQKRGIGYVLQVENLLFALRLGK